MSKYSSSPSLSPFTILQGLIALVLWLFCVLFAIVGVVACVAVMI